MIPLPTLLIFPKRAAGHQPWMLLGADGIEQGIGLDSLPAVVPDMEIVLVAPGERIGLRWLELPRELAPAQMRAAAQLALAGASIDPGDAAHIAVGVPAEGRRCVALVSAQEMSEWLAALASWGLVPGRVVPEPLLLLPPPGAGYRARECEGISCFRATEDAFCAEPDIAHHILGDAPVEIVDETRFASELGAALAGAPLDLLQGPFARRTSWRIEVGATRRVGLLISLLLCATVALSVVELLRYGHAAGEIERDARAIAASGPRAGAAPTYQGSFTAMSSIVFGAIRETPQVELAALTYSGAGTLNLIAMADTPATIAALRERIVRSNYRVDAGAAEPSGGRIRNALVVRQP